MASYHRIPLEIKEQILHRIQNDGISVPQAAKEHGIHESTIYLWLQKKASGMPHMRELQSLRKENAFLKTLVGEMTMRLSYAQKKT